MIRPLTFVCLLLAAGSGLYVYQTKHQAQMLDREIARTMKAADATRQRAGLMRAEYALLNDTARLAELSGQFLPDLKTTAPGQFASWTEFERRLPAIGAPPPPPPLEPQAPDAVLPKPLPRSEPARVEPVRPEPVRVEPPRIEPAKPEPARTDLARTEPAKSPPVVASLQRAPVPTTPAGARPTTPTPPVMASSATAIPPLPLHATRSALALAAPMAPPASASPASASIVQAAASPAAASPTAASPAAASPAAPAPAFASALGMARNIAPVPATPSPIGALR